MQDTPNLQVICTQKQSLTADIVLLRLEPSDATPLPLFSAGSHIEVCINSEFTRAYSLCNPPATSANYYEIAIKREENGRGGSIAIHDTVQIGSQLTISQPKNYFPLVDQASHYLLVAAGIGLTPLMAMAYELAAKKKPFTLVVCARDPASLPFSEHLNDSGWPILKSLAGRSHFDLTPLLSKLPEDLHLYCCGPNGFIETVQQQSKHLLEGHFHKEHFTSINHSDSHSDTHTESAAVDLYLSESDRHVPVPEGTSMIQALRAAGVSVDSVCEQGICGSCVVPWRDGIPIHNDECLEPEEQKEYIALCCAGCRSPQLTLEI